MDAHSEVFFTVTGSLEFYNADDSLRQTMDLFSFQKLYLDHCEEKGIKPDDSVSLRPCCFTLSNDEPGFSSGSKRLWAWGPVRPLLPDLAWLSQRRAPYVSGVLYIAGEDLQCLFYYYRKNKPRTTMSTQIQTLTSIDDVIALIVATPTEAVGRELSPALRKLEKSGNGKGSSSQQVLSALLPSGADPLETLLGDGKQPLGLGYLAILCAMSTLFYASIRP